MNYTHQLERGFFQIGLKETNLLPIRDAIYIYKDLDKLKNIGQWRLN